jgi:hypothetical protein
MTNIAPSDRDLAQCIGSAPALDRFEFYREHIARQANDKFTWYQIEAREAWIEKATAYVHTLFQLAVDFELDDREAINYLLGRTVYLHPTIQ